MPKTAAIKTSRVKEVSSIQELIDKIQHYTDQVDASLVVKAYEYSKEAHEGQKRRSGEPYIIHPLAVAGVLADLQMDQESIITALLHDVVEDTDKSLEDIKKEFGPTVSSLVDGVTKISQINFRNIYEKQGENMRKMIVAIGKDVRVLIVKLADRLHNVRTLEHMSSDKRSRIAKETLEIYAPLASRLGMNKLKMEMEDLSFKNLSPETFEILEKKMYKLNQDRETYSAKVIEFLEEELKKYNIKNFDVRGRYKHIYSIHSKMSRDGLSFEDIYDLVAFRVCVDLPEECYAVLGYVHSLWRPVPGRIKDFVSMPKPNNYQSIHTTVIGPQGQKIEIQIRTHNMHLTAERGVAAHWTYKDDSKGGTPSQNEKKAQDNLMRFNWLKDLMSLHQSSEDSSEFLENMKLDLFEAAIYVFTPKGDIKEFPKGATPIDFAYSIHTDVGTKVIGARVNGFQVPLKYKMQNGDTIEIITSNKQTPSKDWLKICVTSRARSKIRNYFNLQEREVALEIGRKIMEKSCMELDISEQEILSHTRYNDFLRSQGFNKVEDFYVSLGIKKIFFQQCYDYLFKRKTKEEVKEDKDARLSSLVGLPKKKVKSSSSPIVIEGSSNIMVDFAKCCNPVLGDSIKGYMSPKRGIVIHRSMCWKLSTIAHERFLEVDWANTEKSDFSVDLKVVCEDKRGTLGFLSEAFTSLNLNIIDVSVKRTNDFKVFVNFGTRVADTMQLQQLIDRLYKVDSVISVTRETDRDS